MKDTIRKGDATAMARESLYFTDKANKIRDHERLVRNRMEITGQSKPDVQRELATIFHGKGEKLPPFLQNALPKHGAAPAEGNPPANPGFLGNDPVTDEPDPDDIGSPTDGIGGDPAGGGGGDDTGNPAGGTASNAPGNPDAETRLARTEKRNALAEDLSRPDGRLDEILAKRPRDLTEYEAKTVMRARMALPSGPEQRALAAFERDFWENAYGPGPARLDATGRMVDAPPQHPFPTQPLPAATPDGEALTAGVRRIAAAVARERDGKDNAVKALQTGINLIGHMPGTPALRIDGVAGPRTRRALRIATARSGPEKVADGMALGRFSAFADAVKSGRADAGGLADLVGRNDAALALKSTVNGLGRRGQPLRLDGRIGPKTTSAFVSTLAATGVDRLTRRFGHALGLY